MARARSLALSTVVGRVGDVGALGAHIRIDGGALCRHGNVGVRMRLHRRYVLRLAGCTYAVNEKKTNKQKTHPNE